MRKSIEERFWSHVAIGEPDDCWPWRISLKTSGYGQFKLNGRSNSCASRMAWKFTFGDPGDLYVLHRCDNRPCCNPNHLFLGTHADNMADMHAKGRAPVQKPEALRKFTLSRRKLTDEEIRSVRLAVAGGESCRSAARRLGVAHTTISRLMNGTHWSRVA